MVIDEKEITLRLESKDEQCMRMLFDRYYHALCTYALKYLPSLSDAEDTVQNVFISLWENKKGQRFEGSLRAYLFGAVTKAALKLQQRQGRFVFNDIEMHVNQLLDEMIAFNEEEAESRKMKLQQEVDSLPPKSKEIFTAIVLENLSYKQTAEKYHVSVNTVKTLYALALRKLRDNLGDLFVMALFLYH